MYPYRVLIRLLPGLLTCLPGTALAETPRQFDLTSDIHWSSEATVFADQELAAVSFPSSISKFSPGAIPVAADIVAYDLLDDFWHLFVVDITTDLEAGTIDPRDAAAWNGVNYALLFEGSAAGIPDGVRIDALATRWQGEFYLALCSFDVTVQLPGGLITADEDIVQWDGTSWSMFFDGSAHGVPAHLDIDGFDLDPFGGPLYFSFDTSGTLPPVNFRDEDIVSYHQGNWSMVLDSSTRMPAPFADGDLDALHIRWLTLFRSGFESPASH